MSPTFRHAVASFEPTADGILLWTRLTGATAASWQLAADPAFADVVASGEATTDASRDHTVVVVVDGLVAATTYWYRFEVSGERSPVGRTRTLPGPGADGIRIGLVSCARYSVAPLGVYRAMAEREVDVVVHLGDYLYEDDGHKGAREHRPPRACVTRDDYRQRFAQLREDPDCQSLHLRHPMITALDDHDVADNCWTTGAKAHDPEEQGPWDDRVRAATSARQEWIPARLRDPDDPRQTWRSVVVGDLAELVVLDTRLSGRDQQAGDADAKELHDPTRSLLGDDQRAWLDERVLDVSRPWMVLVTGVVVNPVDLPLPAATGFVNALLPNGYDAVDGKILHDDQWDGYPKEREHLVQALAERGGLGGRTVILSGDIHSSWAFEGPRDDDGAAVAVEFTTPSAASKPMGHSRTPGAWRVLDAVVSTLEHVPFVDVTARGYGVLDVTRDGATMAWWFVEATDQDPTAGAELGACFTSARSAWPPRLTKAEPAPDPVRPGLPEPLPPRPDDLARLRRGHLVRQWTSRLAGVTVPVGALLLVWARSDRHSELSAPKRRRG